MAHELAHFLRLRRSHARPPAHATGGRRTPGLRREEVAVAAAVSVDYYTRLEQGRESNPSDAVLTAIAQALRLSNDDLSHAIALRDKHSRSERRTKGIPDALHDRAQRLVDGLSPNPAYVLDSISTVVAANAQAFSLFTGLGDTDGRRPNTCRYLLTDSRAKHRFVDWEDVARDSVAALRRHSTATPDHEGLSALVTELSECSPRFVQWWDEHLVGPRRAASKTFRGADGSTFTLPYEVLLVPETTLRVSVYLGTVPDRPEH